MEVNEERLPFGRQYAADYVAACRPAGPEVEPGWTWDGAVYAAPVPEVLTAEQIEALRERLADQRLLNEGLLRAIEIIIREIEYLRPATKPRQTAFQVLIERLQKIRAEET
jgi:hypothetical protein